MNLTLVAKFCTKTDSLTRMTPFFLKLKASLKDPLRFIVLITKRPLFLYLVCHRKTPTLGVIRTYLQCMFGSRKRPISITTTFCSAAYTLQFANRSSLSVNKSRKQIRHSQKQNTGQDIVCERGSFSMFSYDC